MNCVSAGDADNAAGLKSLGITHVLSVKLGAYKTHGVCVCGAVCSCHMTVSNTATDDINDDGQCTMTQTFASEF